ncbi:MAG: hypothetical protein PHC61_04245, partial [Chitinivibrionales bacterium]|nr:hypothetical protein [Chitinivibrionales bacterium]
NEPFEVRSSSTEILKGTTDSAGKALLKNILVGAHYITFPENPLIAPDKPTKIESPLQHHKYLLDPFNENAFYMGSFIVRCEHEIDKNCRFVINPPYFDLVGRDVEESDKVNIYFDNKKTLNEKNGGQVIQESEAGYSKSVMKCGFKGKTDYKMLLNPHFWTDYNKPTEYEIQGLRKKLPIKAYCPDEFKLSINLPPPKKFDIGKKYKGEESLVYDPQSRKFQHEVLPFHEEKDEGQWGKLKHPLAIGTTDKPISLEVNKKSIEISAVDAFASVLLLSNQFGELIELITKSMPKVGWYYTLEYKVMNGKLALAWKWKEHSDHRAFCNMAASVEMTLIDIEWEVGVGVSVFLCEGQVFFQINGEVTLGVETERISPDNALELKIPFGAKLEGVVGARVKVTFMFHAEMTGSTALELSDGAFKISTVEGVSIGANLKWTGFKGKIKVSAGPAKAKGNKEFTGDQATAISRENESTWIEEMDLGKFEWPSEREYQNKYLTPPEIKQVFISVFSKYENLIVEGKDDNSILPITVVIDKVTSHFNDVPHLDRSSRAMEGIAMSIKDRLVKAAYTSMIKPVASATVKYDRFIHFCEEGELRSILKGAENQTEDLKQKLLKT